MYFGVPAFIKDWLEIYREGGFRQLIIKRGWSVLIVFFIYYLIRDTILYILIPYLAFSNIITCF